MLVLIDNYDSFVHNLARYLTEFGCQTTVVRNDAATTAEIQQMNPAAIVISPGPCTPSQAGISCEVIRTLGRTIPVLGVCLGHQAIADALGGKVIRASEPMHGKTSPIHHLGTRLFANIPSPFLATRYHSLIIDESTLPSVLVVTARTEDGIPMAIEHREWPVFGVQFHPESILTQHGRQLLSNFLNLAGIPHNQSPADDLIARAEPEHPAATILPLVPWW
jgi:anthranilate synthase/aminodeoxychorismate synthase-like glutamine amidotransferase